jgi:hypothetical protein
MHRAAAAAATATVAVAVGADTSMAGNKAE